MKIYSISNIIKKDNCVITKILEDTYKNKIDALIISINYNFKKWKFIKEKYGDIADYYADNFMEIFDNEYHDISYEYSNDEFFWKVFDKDIAKLQLSEDKLVEIYDITIKCLTYNIFECRDLTNYDIFEIEESNSDKYFFSSHHLLSGSYLLCEYSHEDDS